MSVWHVFSYLYLICMSMLSFRCLVLFEDTVGRRSTLFGVLNYWTGVHVGLLGFCWPKIKCYASLVNVYFLWFRTFLRYSIRCMKLFKGMHFTLAVFSCNRPHVHGSVVNVKFSVSQVLVLDAIGHFVKVASNRYVWLGYLTLYTLT